jgi:hypothetical protein
MREALRGIDIVFAQAETLEAGLEMLVGGVDAYSSDDRPWLLFAEAYLASLRGSRVSQELTALLVDFRQGFADWLAARGQSEPVATAAVLAAALEMCCWTARWVQISPRPWFDRSWAARC